MTLIWSLVHDSSVQVYNIHYSVSINGKIEEGSMEIDSENNLERFKTGSGDEEAVEIHDFQIGSISDFCRSYFPPIRWEFWSYVLDALVCESFFIYISAVILLVGSYWDPLLRGREVLHQVSNQSQSSRGGHSEQGLLNDWTGRLMHFRSWMNSQLYDTAVKDLDINPYNAIIASTTARLMTSMTNTNCIYCWYSRILFVQFYSICAVLLKMSIFWRHSIKTKA